ncbi:hypothetical protein FS749_009567 [Ceratobasidium sp. UAMH 11750]|nr:hypothetical protein FS749_009567 [Ceratobasidium sp. UAMH 11750]
MTQESRAGVNALVGPRRKLMQDMKKIVGDTSSHDEQKICRLVDVPKGDRWSGGAMHRQVAKAANGKRARTTK